MKKNFSQILGELDSRELDMLLGDVSEKPLARSAEKRIRKAIRHGLQTPKRQIRPIRRAVILAASLLLLISVGFGTHAVVAEAKEYREALAFFEEYDLPTEGLTRAQIKAVYRDITTESFIYSKTAGVIMQNIYQDKVPGFDVWQEDIPPEVIENIWNIMLEQKDESDPNPDECNNYRYQHHVDMVDGIVIRSRIEKYDGDTLLWTASFTDSIVKDHIIVSDGIVVFGQPNRSSGMEVIDVWMAKIDDSGNVLWSQSYISHNFSESIDKVVENEDGTYAMFSSAGVYTHYFCFRKCAPDGTLLLYNESSDRDPYRVNNAIRFGDGYLAHMVAYNDDLHEKIIKVDTKGNIIESFTYGEKDANYYVTDMILYNGNLYLSAYAVPKQIDGKFGVLSEIHDILEYLRENDYEITSEELTKMMRDNYTALLLICDPETGAPENFFSVNGSVGGTLSISGDGKLIWDVESILSMHYTPWASSQSIGGVCNMLRYTFDKNNTLISQVMTGELQFFCK